MRNKIAIKVFYTWGRGSVTKFDPGFGKEITWDIPLLEGYEYSFVENIARDPGSHHFMGIKNPGLIREVQDWDPSAILVYGWSFFSHLKCLRFFDGILPVYFRGDSILPTAGQGNLLKKTGRRIFLQWVYHHIDKALFVGRRNREYFKNNGLADDQLIFVPHAVENDRFEAGARDAPLVEKWKRSLQLNENEIIFLYAGKLDDNKNTSMLIESFLQAAVPGTALVVAGDGPNGLQLKEKYAQEKVIHFLPFQNQSQMPYIYGITDVFVLPSKSETWGLTINEAMAAGKAIICSDVCGAAPDLVINGENGYQFAGNDREDLCKKIRMIADKKMVKRMGLRSAEMIREWTYEKNCVIIEGLVNAGQGMFVNNSRIN